MAVTLRKKAKKNIVKGAKQYKTPIPISKTPESPKELVGHKYIRGGETGKAYQTKRPRQYPTETTLRERRLKRERLRKGITRWEQQRKR